MDVTSRAESAPRFTTLLECAARAFCARRICGDKKRRPVLNLSFFWVKTEATVREWSLTVAWVPPQAPTAERSPGHRGKGEFSDAPHPCLWERLGSIYSPKHRALAQISLGGMKRRDPLEHEQRPRIMCSSGYPKLHAGQEKQKEEASLEPAVASEKERRECGFQIAEGAPGRGPRHSQAVDSIGPAAVPRSFGPRHPSYKKQDTNMRQAVSPAERLTLTLRYLATAPRTAPRVTSTHHHYMPHHSFELPDPTSPLPPATAVLEGHQAALLFPRPRDTSSRNPEHTTSTAGATTTGTSSTLGSPQR
ncbi:hypothetical protein GWK47_037364 [Chionoecetes opilio]|uniref:Uncharacterized protein n=1 Tax=Chionoecetes opilio TaxID=41210 RepID=A0A8J4YSL8_CHIOP|nr:hypothetical protein GWK47_037364 [Chionoecetes opilio]